MPILLSKPVFKATTTAPAAATGANSCWRNMATDMHSYRQTDYSYIHDTYIATDRHKDIHCYLQK